MMVRWFPENKGRFQRRPHYEQSEIDQECERVLADYWRSRGKPAPIAIETDDITKLIEQHVDDLDLYADLSGDGPNVEGVTVFAAQKRPNVGIAKQLMNDDRRTNRQRTTLTHEFGHVHLHDRLYQEKLATGDLFAPQTQERLACKRDTMVEAPATDWMEWQACYFSGAMLMPLSAMVALAREHGDGVHGAPAQGTEKADQLIKQTMGRFAVSFDAARVRLSVLHLILTPTA